MQNILSFEAGCLGSDLITPHMEAPSSALQGVGSDDNHPSSPMEMYNQSLQVGAGVEVGLRKCYLHSGSSR